MIGLSKEIHAENFALRRGSGSHIQLLDILNSRIPQTLNSLLPPCLHPRDCLDSPFQYPKLVPPWNMYLKWGRVGRKVEADPLNLNLHPQHPVTDFMLAPVLPNYMFTLAPNLSIFSSPLVTAGMERVE